MPNRLAQETSPYLLQHAHNPVDWYPWGEEAFAKAREEDKPILLSIGYSACHWCHVMERESFENAETAKLMNESFVNIKVDREERPDVDSIYMEAVVALTGSGGWPLTVFLHPNGEPFYGGTYFPPAPRDGMRSFRDLMGMITAVWRDKREDVGKTTEQLMEHMRRSAEVKPPDDAGELTEGLLYGALENLMATFDWEWGGFGGAPKFPPSPTLEFLLRRGVDGPRRDDAGQDGARRHVRRGRRRLPPLLGRQQVARAALREDALRQRAARRLVPPRLPGDRQGALPRGHRADRRLHAARALTRRRRARLGAGRRHGRRRGPHVHLEARRQRARPVPEHLRGRPLHHPRRARRRAARGAPGDAERAAAAGARRQGDRVLERTRARRARRVRARARPRRLDRRGARRRRVPARAALDRRGPAAPHLARRRGQGHGLPRRLRERRQRPYELHVATGELRWLEESNRLARLALELFGDDENGGFFETPSDGEQLVIRKKDFDDHPAPSGNAMLAYVLLRLSRIYGDDELEERAAVVLQADPARADARAVGVRLGPRRATTSGCRRAARSRSSARPTPTWRAP